MLARAPPTAGKRRAFPRFYFVSQQALLDILANSAYPHRIQKHMAKIFQACALRDPHCMPPGVP